MAIKKQCVPEERIEQELTVLRDFEVTAKEIYLRNKEPYEHVAASWGLFYRRYEETNESGVPLQEEPPFFADGQLTEQDCFPDENMEVAVLLHDRYVPPLYHSLKFIKIVYALRGGFEFYAQDKAGDRKACLREGDFVIIPPEMNQAVFTQEEGAITVNIIIKRSTFEGAFYSLLLENDSISDFFWQMLYSRAGHSVLLVRCGRDELLRRCVLEMCAEGILREKEVTAGKNLIMKGYVLLLFGQALREHQEKMESMGSISAQEAALPVLVRYIRENYTTVTLASLAAHFGKSEGYLSRYIRRETGKTFRFLLKEFRMKQAAGMIENSSCTMEEVAAAVGYADVSCFYRNFKETFCMTPQQYRNLRNKVSL